MEIWQTPAQMLLTQNLQIRSVPNIVSEEEKIKRRPNLSVLALVSFIASFAIARTFTTLNPNVIALTGDFHIHHFWYGIIMMAIGGWLGISYNDERVNRLAAVLFGAGGGLIGDEAGLLLTFKDYWAAPTYTVITIFLALVSILLLIAKYSKTIITEFTGFARTNASLYFGVFLLTISIALMTDTNNLIIFAAFSASAAVACAIILSYFAQRIIRKRRNQGKELVTT